MAHRWDALYYRWDAADYILDTARISSRQPVLTSLAHRLQHPHVDATGHAQLPNQLSVP